MKVGAGLLAIVAFVALTGAGSAQDLGPRVKKLADGVYVHTGKGFDSNSGIILTQEGVVVIDTGQNPIEFARHHGHRQEAHLDAGALRHRYRTACRSYHGPLTCSRRRPSSWPPPVPANSMRGADRDAPDRIQRLAASSPEMKAALEGYRFITPHIEYHDRMTIRLGGRTIELMYLKGVHSEADSAVWLPNERVVFSASAFVVDQINILRPFVSIPDILAAGKMLRALNPRACRSRATARPAR